MSCGRRLYEDTLYVPGGPSWFQIKMAVKIQYARMAGSVFDELFNEDPEELIEFFTGETLKHWAEKNGYKKTK